MNVRETIARELHAPARRRFRTGVVEVKGINDLYQADLVEMIPHTNEQRIQVSFLTIINCFSKVAYALPLKNKSGPEVANALTVVLSSNRMKPLQTDQGLEFYNTHVQKLTKKYGINHYSTNVQWQESINNRTFQPFAERANV